MKIKIYFQEPKKESSSLLISVSWDGIRLQSALGISTITAAFDLENQRFKKNTSKSAQLNNVIGKITQDISDYYYDAVASKKSISKEEMKAKMKNIISMEDDSNSGIIEKKQLIKISTIVNSFFDGIIDNPLYKEMTVKKYKTFKNNINMYLKKHHDILFEKIDYKFLLNFAVYLSSDRQFADATIHKTLKMLSVTLNKAFDDGIVATQFYKPMFKKLFKELKLKIESNKFSLTKEDIQKIEEFEPIDARIKLTKDLFLFEIYTGQRVSDLFNTNLASINLSEKTLNFRQIKTGELVSIPLIEKALNIIKKYPDMKFPRISEQYYNRQIKELAKNAGLTDYIQIERKSLNKTEKIIKEKWELISSHHARVTCIVNMAQSGALPEEIITVSGHSNPRSLDPYMKIAVNEKKRRSRLALERAFD